MVCRSRLLYHNQFRHKFLASTTASAISPYKLHINLNLPYSSTVLYYHSLNGDNRRSLFLRRRLVSGLSPESEACCSDDENDGALCRDECRRYEKGIEGILWRIKGYDQIRRRTASLVLSTGDWGPLSRFTSPSLFAWSVSLQLLVSLLLNCPLAFYMFPLNRLSLTDWLTLVVVRLLLKMSLVLMIC